VSFIGWFLDNISEAIVCAIGYKRAFLALENKSHEKHTAS
jgi:hypothetical protein